MFSPENTAQPDVTTNRWNAHFNFVPNHGLRWHTIMFCIPLIRVTTHSVTAGHGFYQYFWQLFKDDMQAALQESPFFFLWYVYYQVRNNRKTILAVIFPFLACQTSEWPCGAVFGVSVCNQRGLPFQIPTYHLFHWVALASLLWDLAWIGGSMLYLLELGMQEYEHQLWSFFFPYALSARSPRQMWQLFTHLFNFVCFLKFFPMHSRNISYHPQCRASFCMSDNAKGMIAQLWVCGSLRFCTKSFWTWCIGANAVWVW